jgi:uncharacterized membrane protein
MKQRALGLTLMAFGALTVGGWLGGTLVFRHGLRVDTEAAESRPGPIGSTSLQV